MAPGNSPSAPVHAGIPGTADSVLPLPFSFFLRLITALVSCYAVSIMITQTVEIPVSHRLTIDVPSEVPSGRTELIFKPVAKQVRVAETSHMTAQDAIDSGLGFGNGPRIDPMEAIRRCSGIMKRHGVNLSSDDFLAMRSKDKELEDRQDK